MGKVPLAIGFLILVMSQALTQESDAYYEYICNKSASQQTERLLSDQKFYSNDTSIDVHFYHLSLNPSLHENYISANICYEIESNSDHLMSFQLDLANDLNITRISGDLQATEHEDRVLNGTLKEAVNKGEIFSFCLQYEGYPKLLNNIKGLHYQLEDPENPLIVSLSTPFLAHQWWPCKDGPEDKADSVWIDITIPNDTPGQKKLIAVSNGLLADKFPIGQDSSMYRWKHSYPIVPYYIMIAVAPFTNIEESYESTNGFSFPLEYFVFEDHIEDALEGTAQMPEVMSFFESVFGPYPFSDEKYGMTQLGFYGGIENQTNSIVNRMSLDYFMVSVHELAHMWFGDMITCSDWHEGWLNEGFATYAECLWLEHKYGESVYSECMENRKYTSGGTIYLENDTDPFGIFTTIIYYKGAWLLHMLRNIVGDSAFFKALKNYTSNHNWIYGNASTDDLRSVFENESATQLKNFFDQWLYQSHFPIYHYNFEQDHQNDLNIFIHQAQLNSHPQSGYFEMPIDFLVTFENGEDILISLFNEAVEFEAHTVHFNEKVVNVSLDPYNKILCQKTLDQTVSTDSEIKTMVDVQIHPNPINKNDHLNISMPKGYNSIHLINNQGIIVKQIGPIKNVDRISLEEISSVPGSFYLILSGDMVELIRRTLVVLP